MLGVVLWSDPEERKAVIWCEDHGDLAFYSHNDPQTVALVLGAGDLVEFEMTTERNLRLAYNPQLVSEAVYPQIAGSLKEGLAPMQATGELSASSSAQIIPFAPRPERPRTGCDEDSNALSN